PREVGGATGPRAVDETEAGEQEADRDDREADGIGESGGRADEQGESTSGEIADSNREAEHFEDGSYDSSVKDVSTGLVVR
ncbi:hypothetical protein ACFQE1_07535, partial [Halobium palmae]